MPVLESTAAIISAVIAATAATATEVASQLKDDTGGWMRGIICNESSYSLPLAAVLAPIHGAWQPAPPADLPRRPTDQSVFQEWKSSGDPTPQVLSVIQPILNVDDLPTEYMQLLTGWISRGNATDDPKYGYKAPECPVFGLNTTGAGVCGIVCYGSPASDWGCALYLDYGDVAGSPEAGVMVATWATLNANIPKSPRDVRDQITGGKSGATFDTAYSKGQTATASLNGNLHIEVIAAKETTFTITYDG